MKKTLIIITSVIIGFIILIALAGIYKFNFTDSDIYYMENAEEQMVGNDRDEHGCIGSAGYTWNEEKGECIRPWETNSSLLAAGILPGKMGDMVGDVLGN